MTRHAHALLTSFTLVTGGTLLAISLLVIESLSLVPVAIAILVLGVVALSAGHTGKQETGTLALLLARCYQDTVAQVLRDIGECTTAVYLPSNMRQGKPLAAVYRCIERARSQGEQDLASHEHCRGLTAEPDLLVATPGSYCMEMIEGPVGTTVDDATNVLKTLTCGSLDAAQDVRVSQTGDNLCVTFSRHRCSTAQGHPLVAAHFGSPLASIAATVLSEVLLRPVRFRQEIWDRDNLVVSLTLETGGWT